MKNSALELFLPAVFSIVGFIILAFIVSIVFTEYLERFPIEKETMTTSSDVSARQFIRECLETKGSSVAVLHFPQKKRFNYKLTCFDSRYANLKEEE
jgi:hypothetical protein